MTNPQELQYEGWRSGIQQDWPGGGIRFCLARVGGDQVTVLNDLKPGGFAGSGRTLDPGAAIEDWFTIPDGAARALLDALSAHYGGTGDARLARQDLAVERKRVDQLTTALISIATKDTQLP